MCGRCPSRAAGLIVYLDLFRTNTHKILNFKFLTFNVLTPPFNGVHFSTFHLQYAVRLVWDSAGRNTPVIPRPLERSLSDGSSAFCAPYPRNVSPYTLFQDSAVSKSVLHVMK